MVWVVINYETMICIIEMINHNITTTMIDMVVFIIAENDPTTQWQDVTLSHFAAGVIGGKIYVCGGAASWTVFKVVSQLVDWTYLTDRASNGNQMEPARWFTHGFLISVFIKCLILCMVWITHNCTGFWVWLGISYFSPVFPATKKADQVGHVEATCDHELCL